MKEEFYQMSIEIYDKYFIIVNEEGKFFGYDAYAKGYPYFSRSLYLVEKFRTEERANEFLYHAHYTQIMFKKEFKHCVVKKVTVAIT